jgi:hypothetical protein
MSVKTKVIVPVGSSTAGVSHSPVRRTAKAGYP